MTNGAVGQEAWVSISAGIGYGGGNPDPERNENWGRLVAITVDWGDGTRDVFEAQHCSNDTKVCRIGTWNNNHWLYGNGVGYHRFYKSNGGYNAAGSYQVRISLLVGSECDAIKGYNDITYKTIEIHSPPYQPENRAAECREHDEIRLSWNPISNATHYAIRVDNWNNDINDFSLIGVPNHTCESDSPYNRHDICHTLEATSLTPDENGKLFVDIKVNNPESFYREDPGSTKWWISGVNPYGWSLAETEKLFSCTPNCENMSASLGGSTLTPTTINGRRTITVTRGDVINMSADYSSNYAQIYANFMANTNGVSFAQAGDFDDAKQIASLQSPVSTVFELPLEFFLNSKNKDKTFIQKMTSWLSPCLINCARASDHHQVPVGYHDITSCLDFTHPQSAVAGWACDPDHFASSLSIHVWKNLSTNPQYVGGTTANQACGSGADCAAIEAACGGNGNRRFVYVLPTNSVAVGDVISAFAINIDSSGNQSHSSEEPNSNNQTLSQSDQVVQSCTESGFIQQIHSYCGSEDLNCSRSTTINTTQLETNKAYTFYCTASQSSIAGCWGDTIGATPSHIMKCKGPNSYLDVRVQPATISITGEVRVASSSVNCADPTVGTTPWTGATTMNVTASVNGSAQGSGGAVSSSNGTFTITGLTEGTVGQPALLSLNSLPSGYSDICGLTKSIQRNAGDQLGVYYVISQVREPWWQAFGGHVFSAGTGNFKLPGDTCAPDSSCESFVTGRERWPSTLSPRLASSTGIPITYSSSTVMPGGGYITDRLNNSSQQVDQFIRRNTTAPPTPETYESLRSRVNQAGVSVQTFSSSSLNELAQLTQTPQTGGVEIYERSGDLTLNPSSTISIPANRKIIIFVNGELTISGTTRLTSVANGGNLIFIVRNNITITSALGNSSYSSLTPNLQGMFISTTGNITVQSGSLKFVGAGVFAALSGDVELNRDFNPTNQFINPIAPAEVFIFRPDLVANWPTVLNAPVISWREAD